MLTVAVQDVALLAQAQMQARRQVDRGTHRVLLTDPLVEIRLQLAVEAIPQTVYTMCEVAACFLWSLDDRFDKSFHRIADKVEEDIVPHKSLGEAIGDLRWYFRSREIRTEWTHHAPAFVGSDANGPIIVVSDHRRMRDQKNVTGPAQLTIAEFPERPRHHAPGLIPSG
jgi:hypothetical protein